jgi:hypothetical protein
MRVEGIPNGVTYVFEPSQPQSTGSSRLDVHCGSAPDGLYYLKVTASIEATSHSATTTLVVESTNKKASAISFFVAPSSVMLGQNVTMQGAIFPVQNTTITLHYIRPDGGTFSMNVTSGSRGTFAYVFKPDTPGEWAFSATWMGDSTYLGTQSEQVKVEVQAPPPSPAEELNVVNVLGALVVVIIMVVLLYAFILVRKRKKLRGTATQL